MKKITVVLAWVLLYTTTFATLESIKIITTPFSPFVIEQDQVLSGFSIELWKKIAEKTRLPNTINITKNLPAVYTALESNLNTIAIGALPVTLKNEKRINHSIPIYKSGNLILSLKNPNQYHIFGSYSAAFFGVFFSLDVLKVILILILLLFISANIVWFSEREKNPDMFPKKYTKGIWESFWWSSVTITTVGYGDKTPKSIVGRLCALVWMFAGIFIISYFTATISSSQTVSNLENKFNEPHDLIGKQVGTAKGNSSTHYLRRIGVRMFEFDSIDIAYTALKKGLISAVVFDAPVLQYYVKQQNTPLFNLSSTVFQETFYSFGLAPNCPPERLEQINQALLLLHENGEYNYLYEQWFGK